MKITLHRVLFVVLAMFALTSCRTYTMVHYKSNELDKIKFKKYTVYIHDNKNVYKAEKPELTPTGIKVASLTKITDGETISEMKNPNTPELAKKHKNDLNLYIKSDLSADATDITLKKSEINDLSHTTYTSTGPAIGNTIATVIVSGVCVGLLYGVYRAFGHS